MKDVIEEAIDRLVEGRTMTVEVTMYGVEFEGEVYLPRREQGDDYPSVSHIGFAGVKDGDEFETVCDEFGIQTGSDAGDAQQLIDMFEDDIGQAMVEKAKEETSSPDRRFHGREEV